MMRNKTRRGKVCENIVSGQDDINIYTIMDRRYSKKTSVHRSKQQQQLGPDF